MLPGGGSYTELHFSPDGKKLAMCHHLANGKTLKVMNVDGTGMTNMLLGCVASYLEQPEGPQWSPDGTRVLTVSNGDIYTVAIGNGSITQLSSGGHDSQACWSRQGTRIAYVHHEYSPSTQSGDLSLYVMSASGASKKRVTPPGWMVWSHSWGP